MQKYMDEGFSTDKLRAELADPGSAFYFAVLEEQVIGYLKLNTGAAQTELKDDRALEIERIYVLQKYQGQKVGQLLYQKAVEVARQRQAGYIWLGVWDQNGKAIRFYEKQGFVPFDQHVFKLGDDEQIDIMMKLPLH
ncbi:MAG TPA: GNAT family N-acetyltransferase [Chitinophagaceae bacterium]|jgi:ribosomal protein S18 acetylase RimI-like enzyme|nr:GNAT family N-acetyltransferase [Chitinophagaceae bacterium]